MTKDLNKVMLTGYLGADPELRETPQSGAVTTFRVASSRAWQSIDGASHEETEWFRVVAWDALGQICNRYLTKGALDRAGLEAGVVAQDIGARQRNGRAHDHKQSRYERIHADRQRRVVQVGQQAAWDRTIPPGCRSGWASGLCEPCIVVVKLRLR
jgi:hypothetical protein